MSKLVLEVIADSNGLIKGLDHAQSAVNKFMKSAESAGESLGGGVNQALSAFKNLAGGGAQAAGVLAGAFVAASTAAFAMTVEAGKIAEQTEQLAQKTGISATSIEGLSVALARNGLEANSIAMAMKGLSKEMVGVSQGTASSLKLFQEMGVSLSVVEKGTGATLRAIANAFQAMPDGANKARIAVELFGKAGLDWIPMLNKGAAGLDEAMKKSAEFGLILTDTARGDLTVFDDAMDDLMQAVKGFGMQVGAAFAPSLTALVKGFTEVIVFTKNVFNQFADAASVLSIRLAGMVASVQLLGSTLFSLKALSMAAWQETMNHVKAIDAWAASEIKGVAVAREAEKSLDALAIKQLDAAKAANVHALSQEKLGAHIVSTTKTQLAQLAELNKNIFTEIFDAEEQASKNAFLQGPDPNAETGRQRILRENLMLSQADFALQSAFYAQAPAMIGAATAAREKGLAVIEAESAMAAQAINETMEHEDRKNARLIALDGETQAKRMQIAKQFPTFWEQQLNSLVASNAFSVSQIVTTWTSGIANAVVTGGNFVQAAWQSTQIAIIQGAVNTGIQLAAQWALQASVELGMVSATEAAKLGLKAASNATIVAGDAAAAGASVGIWAGATAAITGFFAATGAAFTAVVANMVVILTAVGTFIMGVLSSIAAALTATVFGIPWAGAILVGIAAIAIALAATGNLGFKDGGIGDFGSGTPATLHGQEAIIPLNSRGASFMQDMLGAGGEHPTPIIQTHVMLNGREIATAMNEYQPLALRTMGVL